MQIENQDAIKHSIEHFFWAFREFLKFIDENCKNRLEGVILICSYLDSLSSYKYGRSLSNRNRFTSFILNYSGLADIYSLISLPLFKEELKKTPHYDDIVRYFEKELFVTINQDSSSWEYLNEDVSLEKLTLQIENSFPQIIDDKFYKIAKKYQYVEYFYENYRCKVIHESRLPEEEAPNFSKNERPYYTLVQQTDMDYKLLQKEVFFGVPFSFMIRTLNNCINNYESECIQNSFDPFAALDIN